MQYIDSQQYAEKLSKFANFILLESQKAFIAFYIREEDKTSYIPIVWVDNTMQRKGIAKKMLNLLISNLRSKGYESISLEVVKDNIPAYNLYCEFGFTKKEDRNTKLLMELNL